jgi:hypothetical protein
MRRAASRASLHSLHSKVTAGRSRVPGSLGLTVTERPPVAFRPFSIPDGVTSLAQRVDREGEKLFAHDPQPLGIHPVATKEASINRVACLIERVGVVE